MPNRLLILLLLSCAGAFLPAQSPEVVIYVSHDQEYSETILKRFEERTGIRVRANYDTEDNKTIGLVNRILAERASPVADVYWNNECGHSVRLRDEGLLEPYASPVAATIPAAFRCPKHTWTGFAARARVLAYNPNLIKPEDLPQTMEDLALPKWRGKLVMAKPLTGTTRTHIGALYAAWGEERTERWLDALSANEVLWERGNGPVAQAVGEGVRPFGLTDTDDVNARRTDGMPIAVHYLGQNDGGEGTLVIPNSVMILKGSRNLESAKKLIDYLVSAEVEGLLAASRAAQMPLQPNVAVPDHVRAVDSLKAFEVSFDATGAMLARYGQAMELRFNALGTAAEGQTGNTGLWITLGLIAAAVAAFLVRGRISR